MSGQGGKAAGAESILQSEEVPTRCRVASTREKWAAPSTRGQWQSNAYDILRPRCQLFMTERGQSPNPIVVPGAKSPSELGPEPFTYSVHSPQVTGSPFKLIDRRLEGAEYIDARAVLSPRRCVATSFLNTLALYTDSYGTFLTC